ncbi:MAG TPA: hypothetical protein GXX53_10260 [Tissierellia bacterium]|nr:hypothetical protein [Tissierellia bacterium]
MKANPEISNMYEFDKTRDDTLDLNKIRELTLNDKLVLIAVALTIVMLVVGVIKFGWYIMEISALFLGMAIVVSLIAGLGLNGFGEQLVKGMADLTGITRQTAVLAFQLGDGISNVLTPTSGYFMAGLALAKIPWEKWAKWFVKLALIQYLVGAVFVLIAHLMKLGPF